MSLDTFRPIEGAPAGWYPLPGGGQRYWDGRDWAGDPIPGRRRWQEPPDPNLVKYAVLYSVFFSPVIGIVMGLFRLRKNRSDGVRMIYLSLAVWVAVVIVVVVLFGVLGLGS